MVGELLRHVEAVQQIEGSMRLVTLNAAVKCAQLGPRGKALDVIAKQLRELTGDTVTSARTVMSVLGEAAERARRVAGSADGAASEGLARLGGDADAAIALFSEVDGRLSAALHLLDEEGRTADAVLKEAARHFSGHAAISEALGDAQMRLSALLAQLPAVASEVFAASNAGARLLAYLRRNYTMESERRIHDGLFGAIGGEAPVAAPMIEADDLGLF